MRERTNPELKRRLQLWKQHKLGELIQDLSGKPTGHLDLQSLPSPTHGQITNQAHIQDITNEYLADWHAIPKELDSAANHIARHPTYWKHLLRYQETGKPQLLTKKSNIPPALQDSLRRACAIKVSPDLQEHIHHVTNQKITFHEFNRSLSEIVNGSAPGPSGVTANMAKAWSPSIRRLVYYHMENVWNHRESPKWMKDKVIKLAPKIPGNSELKNMRPISLYEVARKAWTTIIGKRIHLAWHNNDVLHNDQHGYRLDRGTQMALLAVIDELEDASHQKTTKHATFWDIKRAFDSIPRTVQKLAWVRLGVPPDVADWFVALDDGGLSFISTPFYHANKDLHTPDQLRNKDTHFSQAPHLAYEAERGIGQGESLSSLMWTALYDILLEFIDPSNRHLHVAENLNYSDHDIAHTNSNAFADDLATVTSGPNGEYMQQLQATWLSAFCAFAGLVMHPTKIKPTILGPIPTKYTSLPIHGPLPHPKKTDLIIHDLNWNPISCPILPHLQFVKYLGVILDLRPTTTSPSHEAALQHLNTHLTHLLVQTAPPGAKIDYILFKLLPTILTTAIVANWTLKQYRALDTPLSRAYRLILAFPANAPEHILYMPKTEMGVGLPRLSDKAQVMKWETLVRCTVLGGPIADTVTALFDRLPPTTTSTTNYLRTISPPTNKKQEISWPQGKRFLVRSLVEWFHQSNLSITLSLNNPTLREDQDRNNRSIADLAEDLRLWPSNIWDDEDNENLPPVRLVATDGSFKIKPRGIFDLLTSEYELQRHGEGAAGIIVLPPGYSETSGDLPHGIRITLSRPSPGMNAYLWELSGHTISLHLLKYHNPNHVVMTSDCCSAMARTNTALSSRNNTLANKRGGVIVSGAHTYANTHNPIKFIHTKHHPERDKARRENPKFRDKAILMADALAGGTKATLGGRAFPMRRHTLRLDDLFTEIIPPGHWHLRTTGPDSYPVVADILPFQHAAQNTLYCRQRDLKNATHRWTSTSFALAHRIHPPRNRSHWAAGRRALVAYDWIGHGRNRAKPPQLSQEERTIVEKCYLCGQMDSQAHCMLDCPHPPLIALRQETQKAQEVLALTLLKTTNNKDKLHFIHQFIKASWTSSDNTPRIWLGLWNEDTLSQLMRHSIDAPLSEPNRNAYIILARTLTSPLITAYYQIQDILTHQKSPLIHSNPTPSSYTSIAPLSDTLRDILINTYHQCEESEHITTSSLHHIQTTPYITAFSLCDSAFGNPQADGAF